MLLRQIPWRRGSSRLRHAASYSSATTQAHEPPRTIFSGIQPSGVPHIGNYLGALSQWVKLQNESPANTTLIYSLVDLHAITIQQPPAQLRQWKRESLATLLALGLDPARSIIFHQSDVPQHAELMWILSCQASTGALARMTQWKDKTASATPNPADSDADADADPNSPKRKLGLFSYPVLQAADILAHGATHVPVGHDQAQHLEFARGIATSFNHAFPATEPVLTPPQTLISPAKRVMSLTDPGSKMSKSVPNPRSRILLNDPEEDIRLKVKAAITDSVQGGFSYDPVGRPGVSNLLEIMFHLDPKPAWPTPEALGEAMKGSNLRVLKERVANAVVQHLQPIRERFEAAVGDEKMLKRVAREGAEKARGSAEVTMKRVRDAVGLR